MTTPFRVMPTLEEASAFFWRSGQDGRLRFLGCDACGFLIHPPAPYCPTCQGREVSPTVVSGRGTVHTFTVNHQPWDGSTEPYVIAVVELEEQHALRLTTNIIGAEPDDVFIGMGVEVVFEDHDPVFVPLFSPIRAVHR